MPKLIVSEFLTLDGVTGVLLLTDVPARTPESGSA
jgi:hypothetical protein